MPGLTLTPDQRVALAEKLDLDPWTMTPQTIASRMSSTTIRQKRLQW